METPEVRSERRECRVDGTDRVRRAGELRVGAA